MMKRFAGVFVFFLILNSLLGCSPKQMSTQVPAEASLPCTGPAIRFGDISDDPDEVITGNQPLANYLAGRLERFGIVCGKMVVLDTVDEMVEKINNEEVDIIMDSMYPATLIKNETGAEPILRRWRNCDPDYYSVIFTSIESGIRSIDDLPGHMIAMDRSYSTSGFALPAVYLVDHGLNLVVKDSYDDPVSETDVGIFFSLDDKNTLNLILEGKVSAGTTDDYYFGKWDKEAPGKFVKLAETESIPRQAVLVRESLASDLKEAIQEELAQAHLNPEGLLVLKQSADTCKFDDPPEGIEAVFEQMQEMHNKIQAIPGWQEAFMKGY